MGNLDSIGIFVLASWPASIVYPAAPGEAFFHAFRHEPLRWPRRGQICLLRAQKNRKCLSSIDSRYTSSASGRGVPTRPFSKQSIPSFRVRHGGRGIFLPLPPNPHAVIPHPRHALRHSELSTRHWPLATSQSISSLGVREPPKKVSPAPSPLPAAGPAD